MGVKVAAAPVIVAVKFRTLLIKRLQQLLTQRIKIRFLTDQYKIIATKGSAQVLRRDDIGELAPGKRADIAFFKLDEPRFSGAHDPLAALVLCGASQADAVMINGDWKVRDKQWLGGDIRQLMANHQQAASQLFSGH